jgi:uncharacterized protein YaiL (DUF2058 family)
MNNPFQDQLLKAGLVTKKQVQKAQQDQTRKKKQQHNNKKAAEQKKLAAQQAAKQAAEKKARRDLELNKKKEEQARQKANSIEINQLITNNCLARDESCEIVYNFEHNKKIKRIYVDDVMKEQIIKGKLGIARIEGRYELVPLAIAEKIQQRNPKRIVIFSEAALSEKKTTTNENDPYSEHQIPDDLMW